MFGTKSRKPSRKGEEVAFPSNAAKVEVRVIVQSFGIKLNHSVTAILKHCVTWRKKTEDTALSLTASLTLTHTHTNM